VGVQLCANIMLSQERLLAASTRSKLQQPGGALAQEVYEEQHAKSGDFCAYYTWFLELEAYLWM
jgi:hypothetical protein